MLSQGYSGIQQQIGIAVKSAAGWITGLFLFGFILLRMAFSFIINPVRKSLHLPGLYNFREDEFPALDVILKGTERNIFLGSMPSGKDEVCSYQLKGFEHTKEVLLQFTLEISAPDAYSELTYCVFTNETPAKKEYLYFFIRAIPDTPGLNYNKVLLWFPVPAENIFNVQCTDILPSEKKRRIIGEVAVINWR